jgi:hypothetical protein
MKKISVLLIAFLLVASFAFAEETFSVAFSGSASATFGMDLDNQQTGFRNASTARARMTFLPTTNLSSEGSDWYGLIELQFRVVVDAQASGTFTGFAAADGGNVVSVETARITNDVVYINLLSPGIRQQWASNLFNQAAQTQLLGTGFRSLGSRDFRGTFASAAGTGGIAGDAPFPGVISTLGVPAGTAPGITIGFSDGVINDLSIGIVSDGDWQSNDAYEYGTTINADVTVDIVRIQNRTFLGYGLFTDADMNFGNATQLGVTLEDTGTSVTVGADLVANTADFADTLAWKASLRLGQELADGTDVAAMVVLGETGDDLTLDFGVTFVEATADGLVPGVGAKLGVVLQQVLAPTDAMRLAVLFDVEYDEGGINPFAGIGFHSVLADDNVAFLAYEAGIALGADFHGIENTTFTLRYRNWDPAVPATTPASDIGSVDMNDLHPGFISLTAAISF